MKKVKNKKGKILIDRYDIIGKRLGKLEVLSYAGHRYDDTRGGQKMRHWYLCKCDCGTYKQIRRCQLIGDKARSCGCSRNKFKSKSS